MTKVRVCAVSYLNTVPLVWGMTHGPHQQTFDLSFSVPSECANRLETGVADIGLVPCAELDRLRLTPILDVGIACRGPVRSILLISKVEPARIRTLATDSGSRTSVMLARIVLLRKYGISPQVLSMTPALGTMLEAADAALIIGDPALHLDPAKIPEHVLDLGEEWLDISGLPMVFAVWAGKQRVMSQAVRDVFAGSCRYGIEHLDEIVQHAVEEHNVPASLAREYLTRHIIFELEERDRQGLELFRRWASEMQDESQPSLLEPVPHRRRRIGLVY